MKHVVLNLHFVRNRIAELQLKQWWLAEQIGVDRKTVQRWLQGKVKKVDLDNARVLAKVLGSDLAEISLTDESELLATPEDQKRAAELIASSQFLEKLGPVHEWDVLEALFKATIVPSLPIFVLGELYNKLSIACWRQSKIDQASVYADKAWEIGNRIADKGILATATMSQANIMSWRGQSPEAIKKYQECLGSFLEPEQAGAVHSNLGALLWEIGDLKSGLEEQLKAQDVFNSVGTDMNRSICQVQLSFIYLELERLEDAENCAQVSLDLADSSSYRRGQCMGHFVLGEVAASKGLESIARQAIALGFQKFADLGIEEGFNYEFAGRAYRKMGLLEEAQSFLQKGIPLCDDFPINKGSLFRELGIVQSEMGKSHSYFSEATSFFTNASAPLRVQQVKEIEKSYA